MARPRRRFHHNPQVFGPTPDGYYLIFSIGNDKQPQEIIGCDAQVPPWSCSLRALERREGRSPGVRARVKHTPKERIRVVRIKLCVCFKCPRAGRVFKLTPPSPHTHLPPWCFRTHLGAAAVHAAQQLFLPRRSHAHLQRCVACRSHPAQLQAHQLAELGRARASR